MRLISFILFLLMTTYCSAGGCVKLDHLKSLTKGSGKLERVLSKFEFSKTVWADRRIIAFGKSNFHGLNFGPYICQAKLKSQQGGWRYKLIFYTKLRFYDESGKEVSVWSVHAVRYTEEIIKLEINPIK